MKTGNPSDVVTGRPSAGPSASARTDGDDAGRAGRRSRPEVVSPNHAPRGGEPPHAITRRRFSTGLVGSVGGALRGGGLLARGILAPSEARASSSFEAHVITANLTGAMGVHSHIEVAVDTSFVVAGPLLVGFDVFNPDGTLNTHFDVETDANGFASTSTVPSPNDNLLAISHGAPALVRVRLPQWGIPTSAALHYSQPKAKLRHNLSADRRADSTPLMIGRQFGVAIGDIVGLTSLLIGNISASDVNIDVFRGTVGTPGNGVYNHPGLPNRNTWRVDLQPTDAGSRLVIRSTGELIVQLAVAQGNNLDMTTILPDF
jgi:hypothetical protein